MTALTLTPGAVTLARSGAVYWDEAAVTLDPSCRAGDVEAPAR